MVNVIFVQPFDVNALLAEKATGRVVVLDVAFNAGSTQKPGTLEEQFQNTSQAFINALGDRLAVYVDHHPHKAWADYAPDTRFVLVERDQAPACPVLITPELVASVGPVDTIVAHGDFDGIMSAAMWALGGQPPYVRAVSDAIIADARVQGKTLTKRGQRLEAAMKANMADDSMRLAIFQELVSGYHINQAQGRYQVKLQATEDLMLQYRFEGKVAVVDARAVKDYDMTLLLVAGQNLPGVQVALVKSLDPRDSSVELITIAAQTGQWDFPTLFGLPGGMRNRVTLPAAREQEVIAALNQVIQALP